MTKFLLSLLALLVGFSAADAGRPLDSSTAALGCAAAVSVAVIADQVGHVVTEFGQINPRFAIVRSSQVFLDDVAPAPTFIYYSDRLRQ